MKEALVVSLGGSVFVQDTVKMDFITQFVSLVRAHSARIRFIIVVGGGKTCRFYQDAARSMGVNDTAELDRIGIRMTHVNAELFRALLGKDAHDDIIINPTRRINTDKILVAGGWKPGCSTDKDTVLLAKRYGARKLINITNTDYLYDKNPREHKDAKAITRTTWKGLQEIVGTKWKPGLNAPFDPVATKLAAKLRLELVIAGPNLVNLGLILDGKDFKGTLVS